MMTQVSCSCDCCSLFRSSFVVRAISVATLLATSSHYMLLSWTEANTEIKRTNHLCVFAFVYSVSEL